MGGGRRGWNAATTGLAALILSVAVGAGQSRSPVADAAMNGDRATVESLLKTGGDVNAAQGDGATALHWAAMKNDAALAKLLIGAGASVKAVTRLGASTPLALAAENGSGDVVEVLLKSGADVSVADAAGNTPLMLAAGSGQAGAVRQLLAAGADVNATEKVLGQTALMFAAAYNRVDAIKALLAAGADVRLTNKVVNVATLTDPLEFRPRSAPVPGAAPGAPGAAPAPPPRPEPARPQRPPQLAGVERQFRYNELVGTQGGLTALLFAVRQGHREAVRALLDGGASVNQVGAGSLTSPLLMAVVNGQFDLAKELVERGADVTVPNAGGVTPLYGVLNVYWGPKSMYPQPRAQLQQECSYLDLMKLLLDKGADVNARVAKKVWFTSFNTDLSGVDEIGATPFWRAAYAADVDAMKLLVAHGADPNIPTMRPAGRPFTGDGDRNVIADVSGMPPVPVGGPGVPPLVAASGVGYGEGFAANSHRHAPAGIAAALKYMVEELGADVNAVDFEGNNAIHHSAARGDVESILYLVSKGGDVTRISREGRSTADMANAPVQRVQPFPEALALLIKLGAKNNNKCVSC